MASLRDFEKLWEQYQKDGVKRDITIARYYKNHGIVYATSSGGIKAKKALKFHV